MTATGVTDAIESITPTELHARIDSDEDVFLLDVRSASDFDAWHIDGPPSKSSTTPTSNSWRAFLTRSTRNSLTTGLSRASV